MTRMKTNQPRAPQGARSTQRSLSTALMLGTALCLGAQLPQAVVETAAAQETTTHTFEIPAGPLTQALRKLADQSGLQIAYSTDIASSQTAPAITGTMTAEDALTRLLSSTHLHYRFTGANTVTILDAATLGEEGAVLLDPITVTEKKLNGSAASGYRVGAVNAGVLGEKSLQDTPYSIEVFSRDLMDNLQARSLADVTKTDASVALMSDNLVTENNALAIRGLTPDGTTGKKIDGLNVRIRADDLPLEHFERVEILKGASGFLYGFGTPGGTVNYVTKRPTDETTGSLNAQVMDSGLALVHGDAGGRFGADEVFGYRVNLVHESGDTYIEDGESRRTSGSLAADWRITPDLVWQADLLAAEHMREGGFWALIPNADGAVNNYTLAEPLSPIDGDERLAPSFTRYGSRHFSFGTDISWSFAQNWKLMLAHRISDNGRQYLLPAIFADVEGDYSLRFTNYANRFRSRHSQGMVTGEFETGPLTHDVTFGTSYTKTESAYTADDYQAVSLGSGNLSDPIDFPNPFDYVTFDDDMTTYERTRRRELFLSDTLHIGEQLDLIVGVRQGNLRNEFSGYDKDATTPTLAAVYRPLDGISVYASYIEALEEGATAPATAANAFEVFEPLVSEQYEIGIKAEGEVWSASAALFRLERGLTYTDASNVFTQDGEARYDGVELSGKFHVTPQWFLGASLMYLDATNQKTSDATLEGKRIQGVAEWQEALYTEYTLSGLPLTLTAGARHVGERPVDANNTWYVDSVTLFDAGARYEADVYGSPVTFRLNVENVADEAYWITQPGSGYLRQGAPRTIKLGAQLTF